MLLKVSNVRYTAFSPVFVCIDIGSIWCLFFSFSLFLFSLLRTFLGVMEQACSDPALSASDDYDQELGMIWYIRQEVDAMVITCLPFSWN
jgi:hypothetical protein